MQEKEIKILALLLNEYFKVITVDDLIVVIGDVHKEKHVFDA